MIPPEGLDRPTTINEVKPRNDSDNKHLKFMDVIKKIIGKILPKEIKIDADDKSGWSILDTMQRAGSSRAEINRYFDKRRTEYEQRRKIERDKIQLLIEEKKEADKEKLQNYRNQIPEGAEIQTRNIEFSDLCLKNVDMAIIEGSVVKILNNEDCLEASGTTLNAEELNVLLEPLKKLAIVTHSSGFKTEGGKLSEVILNLNELNKAISAGKIKISIINRDEASMEVA